MELPALDRDTLAAILIVEASQRPDWFQRIEWAAVRVGLLLRVPRRLLPRTVGPLQLVDAPPSFPDAVMLARQKLNGHLATFEDVAAEWYGSRSRMRGSSTSYALALAYAMDLWQVTWRSVPSKSIVPRVCWLRASTPTPKYRRPHESTATIALDPGVVSGRDFEDVVGLGQDRRTIVHDDPQSSRDDKPEAVDLA